MKEIVNIVTGSRDKMTSLFPPDVRICTFGDITRGIGCNSVIQGYVHKVWDLNRSKRGHLKKIVIKEDETSDCAMIPVFLFGRYAEKCQCIRIGDLFAVSNFEVEPSTSSQESTMPWQIMVGADSDKGTPRIWIDSNSPTLITPSTSTGAASTSKATKSSRRYNYTSLCHLKAGTTCNVYGVVKYFRPAAKTRGTDYMMFITLVDHTTDMKLKCMLFCRDVTQLPCVEQVGCIVRLHRLKIVQYQDELQGQSGPGFSSVAFGGGEDDSLTPKAGSDNYTITPGDLDQVRALRLYASSGSLPLSQPTMESQNGGLVTLAQCKLDSYFDLICQVVSCCVLKLDKAIVLRVWDGTKPGLTVHREDLSNCLDRVAEDPALVDMAGDLTVDLFVFDNHVPRALLVQPGDYLKAINLHAYVPKPEQTAPLRVQRNPEIVLHRGGHDFGRSLHVLDRDDPDTASLRERLSRVPQDDMCLLDDCSSGSSTAPWPGLASRPQPGSSSGPQPGSSSRPQPGSSCSPPPGSTQRPQLGAVFAETKAGLQAGCKRLSAETRSLSGSDAKRARLDEAETKRHNGSAAQSAPRTTELPRCMLQTATIMKPHHDVPMSRISEVITHSVPYKFRLQCEVQDVSPRPRTVQDLIRLYCPECHYSRACDLAKDDISGPSVDLSFSDTDLEDDQHLSMYVNPVRLHGCPVCSTEPEPGSAGKTTGVTLRYAFMLQLLLKDDSGWLLAGLWDEQAERFFHHTPEEVLQQSRHAKRCLTQLRELFSGSSSRSGKPKPMIECCVMSYNGRSGTCYQVFDTCLELTD